MIIEDIVITTDILLQGASIFALLDAVLIPLLIWQIKPALFIQIKWTLVIISGLAWFGIWKLVLSLFWDSVYIHVFPEGGREWLPLIFGLLMAGFSLGIWSLARNGKHHPLPIFFFLSGFWGVLTHIWAIQRGILRPPMLRGASPLAALLIAFFEYIFYWCIITFIAATIHRIYHYHRTK